MSRRPVHENTIQRALFEAGELRRGPDFANTNPDYRVRIEGVKRIGGRLAVGVAAVAFTLGAYSLLERAIDHSLRYPDRIMEEYQPDSQVPPTPDPIEAGYIYIRE